MRPSRKWNIFPLVMFLLMSVLLLAVVGPLQAQAFGTLSGIVFDDFNNDGNRDVAVQSGVAFDIGVGDVTLTAYDGNGVVQGLAISCNGFNRFQGNLLIPCTNAERGQYSMVLAGPGPYRIEATNLPAGFQNGIVGTGSDTSVGFIPDLAGANAVADFAIQVPGETCQNNPDLVTTCAANGDPLNPAIPNNPGNLPALVTWGYRAAPGQGPVADAPLAIASQIGSTWGVAVQRPAAPGAAGPRIFTSAYVKRHAGLGPLGVGGIYLIDPVGPTVTNFVDVATIGIGVSVNFPTNAARGLGALNLPSIDVQAFGATGKVGIGDIEMSEDGRTIWLTNLNDRDVYSIFVDNPPRTPTAADVRRWPAPWANDAFCPNGVGRPWGLKTYRGLVYVGVVCTGEFAGTPADLGMYVYALDPNNGIYTLALNLPVILNYPRGYVWNQMPTVGNWQTWNDIYTDARYNIGPFNGLGRPQPIVSDIEFDADGNMIIAFMDRTGNQIGWRNYRPTVPPIGTDPLTLVNPYPGGEILKACRGAGGGWAIENNGSCGGVAGTGVGNGFGPGGGEFFAFDRFRITGLFPAHHETSFGSLTQMPGAPEVVLTAEDTGDNFDSGGVNYFTTATGAKFGGDELYFAPGTGTGFFGKANGLGDMEVLCSVVPAIEIGNRVWLDSRQNGVQDPDENPIAGVNVNLYDCQGNLLGTAVTDAQGRYGFTSAAVPGQPWVVSVPAMVANTCYQIRLDDPADYAPGGPLQNLFATLVIGDTPATGMRDSDGSVNDPNRLAGAGNFPIRLIRTQDWGWNNHTYDFGFNNIPPVPLTPTPGTGQVAPGLNPAISKVVDPPFAQPGNQLTWRVTVSNPHNIPLPNVSFTDNMDSRLDIISTSTSAGNVTVSGQTVTWSIAVLNPGQSVTTSIVTRIRSNTAVPFTINNLAVLGGGAGSASATTGGASGAYSGQASATVLSVGSLPATGYEPWWRTPLIIITVGLALGLFSLYWRKKETA